jgi:hypothetical protein
LVLFLYVSIGVFGSAGGAKSNPMSILMNISQMMILLGEMPHGLRTPASNRVCLLLISLGAFLIFVYYTAFLTSFMTISDPPQKIEGFKDVLAMDYNILIWKGSFNEQEFSEV